KFSPGKVAACESLIGNPATSHEPRGHHRLVPHLVRFAFDNIASDRLGSPPVFLLPVRWNRPRADGCSAVEDDALPGARVEVIDQSGSAEAAHHRANNRLSKRGSNCSVDYVSTGREDLLANAGRLFLGAD